MALRERGKPVFRRGTHPQSEPRNWPGLDYKYTSEAPTTIKRSYYRPNPPNRSCAAGRGYITGSVRERSTKHRAVLPVSKSGYPPCPCLTIRQHTPEHALDVEGWTRCTGKDDVTQLLLQVARYNVCPFNAVLRRVIGRLMAQTGDLICTKDTEEPNCSRGCNSVGV
jgi:hypothetical protein